MFAGGSGVVAFELKRQYPGMDITVFEMENVVQLANEKFLPGKEHLGVKFVAGQNKYEHLFVELQN